MKKGLVFIALVFTATGLFGSTVAAADQPDKVLTVSPAATKPEIAPGQTKHDTFQVINQGKETYAVKIYAAPYGVHGEEYTPDFSPIPGKTDVASWITFDKSGGTLNKAQTLDIGYTIAVPEDTAPGGYYAVAFAETEGKKDGNGVIVNQRVGEVFYIKVTGDVKQAGKILSWKVPFLQQQPLKAELRLQNDGGVHYGSDTKIQVKDIFGRTKYNYSADKQVLPQTIRQVGLTWEAAPPLGLFRIAGSTHLPSGDVAFQTKYVLVISPLLRLVFGSLIVVVVIAAVLKLIRHLRAKSNRNTR